MTTRLPRDRLGFLHELVLHSTTEEMLEFVVAFAQDGVAAEEPTLLAVRPETAATVLDTRRALTAPAAARPWGSRGGRRRTCAPPTRCWPATAARHRGCASSTRNRRCPRRTGTSGAASKPSSTSPCAATTRGRCVSTTGDRSPTNWSRTSTRPTRSVGRGDQHRRNDRYQDPVEFISKHPDAPPDPVERAAPSAQLIDPSPAAARAAVTGFTRTAGLPGPEIEGLILATSEAVTNAIVHGRPPVVLRLWAQPAG